MSEKYTNDDLGESSTPPISSIEIESLRLSQNFALDLGVKELVTTIPVRKPGKREFIRTHKGFNLETMLLEFKEEQETYLVHQELWQELGLEVTPKVLVPYITRQGFLKVWPIKLPDEHGRLDEWNRSALAAASQAESKWIKVVSNMEGGLYQVFEAQGSLPEPEWPTLTLGQVLETAFKDGRYIVSMDHPAIAKLKGLS